jgi:hypothetical protein
MTKSIPYPTCVVDLARASTASPTPWRWAGSFASFTAPGHPGACSFAGKKNDDRVALSLIEFETIESLVICTFVLHQLSD